MTDLVRDHLQTALGNAYTIERELGAGGMATVWLAEDVRHHRRVALKVLRPELAASLGPERFRQEIEVTAALQHPHILPLFDSGESGGLLWYVMPYVEGESLRARLEREGRLSVAESVRLASEVASALALAHRHGVVHRDVKPENILLLDGRALLADFGIARDGRGVSGVHTGTGITLGTPQYMSPEQATAERDVDARTDVYALGAVLYEMLAGTPPHTGPNSQVILARLLTEQPTALAVLRPDVPAFVAAAVTRALAKTPADRFSTAAEFEAALAESTSAGNHGARPGSRRRGLVAIGTGIGVLVLALAIGAQWRAAPTPLRPDKVTHFTREPGLEVDPALSPDGQSIAYAAGPLGDMRIYVRQRNGDRAIPIAESLAENQRWPQWSPDGNRIAFQVGHSEREGDGTSPNALYVVRAQGGEARRLLADSIVSDITPAWSPDGTRIVFARGDGVHGRALYEVDAAGAGAPRKIIDAATVFSPRWSPDGSMLVYVTGNSRFTLGTLHLGNDAPTAISIVTIGDGRVHRVTNGTTLDVSPVWTPDSRSVFFVSNRDGSRDVYRVSVSRAGEAAGTPERITTGLSAHGIDLSRDGRTLTYSAYTPYAHVWSVLMPDTGIATQSQAKQHTTADETVEGFALSTDGRWLAYDSDRSGNGDIWKVSADGGQPALLTTDPHGDYVQDWSSDGREIAFHSFRNGRRQVFVMMSDGSGVSEVSSVLGETANPDFSPDGNSLVFELFAGARGSQLLISTRARRGAPWGTPRQIMKVTGTDPSWSPDGRSIAYIANGVRVVNASGEDDRVLVPRTAGAAAFDPTFTYWSADSRTLYYKAYDARQRSSIWAVPAAGGPSRLLIRFDDPARPSARREFATDGRRLYFTVAAQQSDIWVMDLVPR